jgi:hypothetical protein
MQPLFERYTLGEVPNCRFKEFVAYPARTSIKPPVIAGYGSIILNLVPGVAFIFCKHFLPKTDAM